MSFLDIALLIAFAIAAVTGFRLGFIARVSSWLGLALGLTLGVLILPFVIDQLGRGNSAVGAGIAIGVLLVSGLIGQAIGFAVGGKFAPKSPVGTIATVDRFAGGFAGLVGAVVLLWMLIPLLTSGPTWFANQTTNSVVARAVSGALGPSPDAVRTIQSAIGEDAFPQVFDFLRPTPNLGAPPLVSGLSPEVETRVAQSIVKLEAEACNRLQDGTGFFVREDLVLTNSHVVAGQRDTSVILSDGTRVEGQVVGFDPSRDLAAIKLPAPTRPALPIPVENPPKDLMGGIFGHPAGGELRIAPFRLERVMTATGRDIYGEKRTKRQVEELVAALVPGDSGSPVVDQKGNVIGISFAVARDQRNVAYALTNSEIKKFLEGVSNDAVPSGRCL